MSSEGRIRSFLRGGTGSGEKLSDHIFPQNREVFLSGGFGSGENFSDPCHWKKKESPWSFDELTDHPLVTQRQLQVEISTRKGKPLYIDFVFHFFFFKFAVCSES